MTEVGMIVLKCHQNLLDDAEIVRTSSLDMEFSRENAIDSLGLISLVLAVEEELNIQLDDYLADIRRSITLSDFVDIVQKCVDAK